MIIDSFKTKRSSWSMDLVGKQFIVSSEGEAKCYFEDGNKALTFWGKLKAKCGVCITQ